MPGHIDMIRNGWKTQTRRINRGIYQEGRNYAVQQKRGVKAEKDIRILIYRILEEKEGITILGENYPSSISISTYDAEQEGGYTPCEYECKFRKAYPKWGGKKRWVFRFCVIEVQK